MTDDTSTLAQRLDRTPPGPALVQLTSMALENTRTLSKDDRLAVLRATERLIAYAQFMQFLLITDLA